MHETARVFGDEEAEGSQLSARDQPGAERYPPTLAAQVSVRPYDSVHEARAAWQHSFRFRGCHSNGEYTQTLPVFLKHGDACKQFPVAGLPGLA